MTHGNKLFNSRTLFILLSFKQQSIFNIQQYTQVNFFMFIFLNTIFTNICYFLQNPTILINLLIQHPTFFVNPLYSFTHSLVIIHNNTLSICMGAQLPSEVMRNHVCSLIASNCFNVFPCQLLTEMITRLLLLKKKW